MKILKEQDDVIARQKALADKIKSLLDSAEKQKLNDLYNQLISTPEGELPKPSAIATPLQNNQQITAQQQPQAKVEAEAQPQAKNQEQKQQKTPQEEAPTSSAVATPPQAATKEEEDLMKKLHGSFDPKSKMDLGKLEQMRAAKKEVGDKADLKTLSKAVYAKQYTKQPAATTQAPAQQSAPQAANQQVANTQKPLNVGNVQIANPNAAAQTSPQSQIPKSNVDVKIPQNLQFNPSATPQAPVQQTTAKLASTPSSSTQQPKPKVDVKIPKNMQFDPNKTEEAEENEDNSKKFQYFGLNRATVQEKNNIAKFLKHLSEKNYSSAHKYLKAIVESKVKRNILQKIGNI